MEQHNTSDQISHQPQEKPEEESGWTTYFDYHFKNNVKQYSSTCISESSSMLSDASSASAAASRRSKAPASKKKPQGNNKKSTAKKITDEGLNDTASSPKKRK
ncbi:unnamed protein product [Rhodiola kirilowii]